MTELEKLEMLQRITGEQDNAVLLTYLKLAGAAVLNRAYPFDHEGKEVPDRYAIHQVNIASYLLNKRGAEGETSHNENGINRSYESGGIPESMLKGIVPFASPFLA